MRYAFKGVDIIVRPEDMQGEHELVEITSTAASGFATPGSKGSRPVLVLLTAGALDDPEVLAEIEQARGERAIPVLIGDVERGRIPEHLHPLHWIQWRGDVEAYSKELTSAIAFSSDESLGSRSLILRAHSWAASGQRNDDLLHTRREVNLLRKRFQIHQPSDMEKEFLQKSQGFVAGRTLVRVGQAVLGAVLAIATVAGLVSLQRSMSYLEFKRQVVDIVTMPGVEDSAEVQSLKVGGVLFREAQLGRAPTPLFHQSLVLLLSSQWPVSKYAGSPEGIYINAATFPTLGHELVLADGFGGIWLVSDLKQGMTEVAQTELNHIVYLDAAPGAKVVCGANDRELAILVDGRVQTLSAPARVTGVVLSEDAKTCVVATTEEVGMVSAERPTQWQQIAPYPGVEVGRANGRPTALIRDAEGSLGLASPGRDVNWLPEQPEGVTEYAISPSGSVYAAGVNAPLWRLDEREWAGSGLAIPGVVQSLTAFNEGVIASSSHRQAFVYDYEGQVEIDGACFPGHVVRTSISADRQFVACMAGTHLSVNELLLPQRDTAQEDLGHQAGSPVSNAQIDDGAVTYVADSGPVTVDLQPDPTWPTHLVSDRTPTSVLTNQTGQLWVGYDDGVVAGFTAGQGIVHLDSIEALPVREPVTGLRLDEGDLKATMGDLTWNVRECDGCGANVQRALEQVRERRPWCAYLSSDTAGVLDPGFMEFLGVEDCSG